MKHGYLNKSLTGPEDARFELEHFLPYRLSLLSNTVSEGIAQFYQRKHRLSVPEWRVMVVLGRYPGSTASLLCERTVMDKVTVSRAVKTLLEKKYVQRITDRKDRRKRLLQVTDKLGEQVLQQVIPFALEYQKGLLEHLSPQESHMLETLLNKLLGTASRLNARQNSD